MARGAVILILSEDDDVSAPLQGILRRAGHRPGVRGAKEGVAEMLDAPPDLLILDRDLPAESWRRAIEALGGRAGRAALPVVVMGRSGAGGGPGLPETWPDDAAAVVGRPPDADEIVATVSWLLRLAFYLPYRELVHDLAQPVTALHAVARQIARLPLPDDAARRPVERLQREAERLMSLMENFQRSRQKRSPAD